MPDNVPAGLKLSVLEALAFELNSHVLAVNFLRDFLSMLPERMARILKHLRDQNEEAAMDAVLSLRVTSSMVGALDAESACSNIEALIRHGRFAEATEPARGLEVQVQALVVAAPAILVAARYELMPVAS